MVLDIIIGIILILTMVFGFRKGFVYTFVHTLGWIGALVAGLFVSPYVKDYLQDKTPISDSIHRMISENFHESAISMTTSLDSLPQVISGGVNAAADKTGDIFANNLTGLIMTVLSFLLVLLGVKIILFLITIAFSKKKGHRFTGFFDGLLGLIAGAVRGIIFVFIFLALLFPAVNLISPVSSDLVVSALDHSQFAKTLYDNNLIILLITDIFS